MEHLLYYNNIATRDPRVLMEHLGSLVAQMAKNLSAVQETWVRFLGWEDPLEKGMAIHSSILAWRIPWTEEPGWLQSVGLQRVGHDWTINTHTVLFQLLCNVHCCSSTEHNKINFKTLQTLKSLVNMECLKAFLVNLLKSVIYSYVVLNQND